MPALQSVEHDPFAVSLEPVDHDPFASAALASSMTHYPPDPASEEVARRLQQTGRNLWNTWGAPFQAARTLGQAAMSGTLDVADPQTAGEAFNLVSGIAGARAPFARAGELGSAGGNLLENQTNTLSNTERFNWPVKLSYGKTIDMPVSINPSRSMIQRELAQAPHGDVRALRAPNGDVYLWPANEAMHVDIADTFDLPFKTRQELQRASYLFNKKDVDALGRFKNFDDLVQKLGTSPEGQ